MRYVGAFPTWALTRFFSPFLPETHPWRFRRFTLREWEEGQTDLCRTFDFGFWVGFFGFTVLALRIWVLRS